MENLPLQDLPPASGANHVQPMPAGPPQLPPQMFTTAAQLLDLTDSELTEAGLLSLSEEKLVLVLRDGRKIIGVLRSWDQFGTLLLLADTIERIFIQDVYADIGRGIFLIRGENVLLLGEIDLDKDDYIPPPFKQVTPEDVHARMVEETKRRKETDKAKAKKLQGLGFEAEHSGEILF
ncbi:SM-like, degradation of cytoplasmic mRNAs and positively regulates transcription initiation [Puttea exsequens]|nr:SM-like, degradation of cytoplasmic mRNAs and positively regulates transcription initiation [Puttea exsequens]